MHRLVTAAAAVATAAVLRARRQLAGRRRLGACVPPPTIGRLLPFTPPPPPRVVGPWRPRIRPELRTLRERVIIYYLTADVPVAATLALAGWPVGGVL